VLQRLSVSSMQKVNSIVIDNLYTVGTQFVYTTSYIFIYTYTRETICTHFRLHINDDDDCFYYHSWRNNVVIAFGILSSFLT